MRHQTVPCLPKLILAVVAHFQPPRCTVLVRVCQSANLGQRQQRADGCVRLGKGCDDPPVRRPPGTIAAQAPVSAVRPGAGARRCPGSLDPHRLSQRPEGAGDGGERRRSRTVPAHGPAEPKRQGPAPEPPGTGENHPNDAQPNTNRAVNRRRTGGAIGRKPLIGNGRAHMVPATHGDARRRCRAEARPTPAKRRRDHEDRALSARCRGGSGATSPPS